MRLFPGDDIPDLTAFSQEMPSPWLMPRGLSRHHRDRLGALVARAIRVFDPRVRCIQLRWVEAPYVRDGRIKLPERVLVWWRSDTFLDDAARVLHEAPKVLYGLHLLDLDGDPGVEALGWLAPLKVRLLHKLTDALLEGGIDVEPEAMIDALNDAAKRLVSPIDLLDFTERLVEARTSGLKPEEARVEAIALVLAGRMAPGPVNTRGVQQIDAAMERAAQPGLLPPDIHSLLLRRGLAETDPTGRPPVLDWLAVPGVMERTVRRLQMKAIAPELAALPPKLQKEALAMSPERKVPEAPPRKTTAKSLQAIEERADEVLEAVRQGEDRGWSPSKKGEAAALLRAFVGNLARSRGDRLTAPLVEREAAVLEIAAQLWEDAAQPQLAAKAWLNAADLSLSGGQVARALNSSHHAIELAGKSSSKSLQAQSFKTLANASVRNDDRAGGQRAYDSALTLYRELGDRHGESSTLEGIGALARFNDDLVVAERSYSEALTTYRAVGERLGEANTLRALGGLYVRTARLAAAEAAYGEALTTYRAVGSRLGEANTLRALGELYVRTARLAEAEAAYGEALTTYRAVGARLGEANTLRVLGELYVRTDRLAEAEAAYGEALTTYRAVVDRLGEANTLWALGELYVRTARLATAEAAYGEALTTYRAVGERLGEANTLLALGKLYVHTARLTEAEAAYGEALTTYRAVEERVGEANTLWALGELYVRTARLAEAEAAYGEALTTYRAVEERVGEANTLRALGGLYVRTARLAEAEAAYGEALTTYRAVEDRLGEANALRGLAVVDLLEGREATEALQASGSLATFAQDQHGALLSQAFLAVADPTSGAVADLDELAASFSSFGLPWEASLARAIARLKAGDTATASSLLRERPETSLLAQEISQATPEEAIRLILPYLPIA
jgi:tetratricopeptide (TPR) repeat protein